MIALQRGKYTIDHISKLKIAQKNQSTDEDFQIWVVCWNCNHKISFDFRRIDHQISSLSYRINQPMAYADVDIKSS